MEAVAQRAGLAALRRVDDARPRARQRSRRRTFGWPSSSRFVTGSTGMPERSDHRRRAFGRVEPVAGLVQVADERDRLRLVRGRRRSRTPPPGCSEQVRGDERLGERRREVRSTPMTSPVDFISGPRYVSTPISFDIENTGALTATSGCARPEAAWVALLAQRPAEHDVHRERAPSARPSPSRGTAPCGCRAGSPRSRRRRGPGCRARA